MRAERIRSFTTCPGRDPEYLEKVVEGFLASETEEVVTLAAYYSAAGGFFHTYGVRKSTILQRTVVFEEADPSVPVWYPNTPEARSWPSATSTAQAISLGLDPGTSEAQRAIEKVSDWLANHSHLA